MIDVEGIVKGIALIFLMIVFWGAVLVGPVILGMWVWTKFF